MRIQNNITAMNTHRMYTINNDNVAKSAEKLSSGYRINRAGDDAAGLAISEKMRSQIRGLNMATKNSQDAISLVQTAEGALQETHSMLQRMNELAVQAATGTNEDLDRTALAKEFEQLKREINDVAEQTNFNNMKILDGSLSYEGYVRSAATAGVNLTVETGATTPSKGVSISSSAATAGSAGATAVAGVKFDAVTQDATKNYQLNITSAKGTVEFLNNKTGLATDAGGSKKVGDLFDGLEFMVDGKKFKIDKGTTAADGFNVISQDTKTEVNWDELGLQFSIDQIDKSDSSAAKVAVGGTKGVSGDTIASTTTVDGTAIAANTGKVNGVTAATVKPVETTLTIDPSQIKDGDSVTIGGKTYVFYTQTGTDGSTPPKATAKDANGNTVTEGPVGSTSTVNVMWNGQTGDSADATRKLYDAMSAAKANGGLTNATAAADDPKVSVSMSGNSITVTAEPLTTNAATGVTVEDAFKTSVDEAEKVSKNFAGEFKTNSTSTDTTKTTVEFDIAKMKDGDKFQIKVGNKEVNVEFKTGDDRAGFMKKVEQAVEKAGISSDVAKVKGNALLVDNQNVEVNLDWDTTMNDKTNAIRIQVGANEHEMLSVAIDSMNTAGLKLDDQFLTKAGNSISENQDLAGKAITAVKNAINKVSDQRATLGAMQNRLDHKIANLKVSSENLSAAESRIRDVDMASEMTNFTKNNILSQAATAMLAQANSLPQNVLSLLG